jgi:GNAT superfamily N-acetyltransferase
MNEQPRERGNYRVSFDKAELDVAAIHAFLADSYWATDMPLAVLERSIAGSACIGLYRGDEQVGFARAVTDYATFAYLMDVYVLAAHRGQGLAKWMVEVLLGALGTEGFRKILLATRDAHALYEQLGFRDLARPELLMEITHPDVYRR